VSIQTAILACVLGLAAVIAGIRGKNFRQTDYITMTKDLGPMPTWLGKALFITVGLIFIAFGIHAIYRYW
jgi:hypothetical protein